MNRNGAVTVPSTWTLIGAAPATVSLVTRQNMAFVIVADAIPTDLNAEGAYLSPDMPVLDVKGAGNIYARAIGPDASTLIDVLQQPGMPANFITGQGVIAVAGTAQQIYPAGFPLTPMGGMIVKASSSNAGTICVGQAGVNNKIDGTGTGWRLAPGEGYAFAAANAALLYVNGTVSGDSFDFSGS